MTDRQTAELSSDSARSNLTTAQFLIWIGQKLNPGVPLYNMALSFLMKGPIHTAAFREAFQALVAGSDAFRTVIDEIDGIPQRRVLEAFPFEMPVLDFSDRLDAEERLKAWVDEKSRQQFDLGDRLFDTALIKLEEDRYLWFLNQHHLITDGWSTAVVYRQMAELYTWASRGESGAALGLPAFEDYVLHEKEHIQTPKFQDAAAYWREKLAEPFTATPFYGKRSTDGSTRTERVYLDLGAERSQRLKGIAGEKGIRALTLDMSLLKIFLTVLFAFLHRVSGTASPRIGAPFHNRPRPAFRETIGLFIEICLLKVDIDDNETFASLLTKVQSEIGQVMRYAQPGTSSSISNRSYDVLLNYIHASFPDFAGHPVEPEWVHPGHGDSHHPLRLQVHDFGATGEIVLAFDLSVDLFDESDRQRLIGHFLQVMDAFIEDRQQKIAALDILTDAERRQLVIEPNQTQQDYPNTQTIVDLFEAQAAQTPDAVAAVCGEHALSYRELDQRSNQLAHLLRSAGIKNEDLVGISMERSLEFVVGVLGIAKAGAAYVPLDPTYPAERARFMLEDMTAARDGLQPILLTQTRLVERLPEGAARILTLDQDWRALAGQSPEPVPVRGRPDPDDLVYVIYTSGSTGKPKGVMIEHRGLVNYLWWARKVYAGDEALDFPLFSSISFDLTVTSIYVPLISGGRTVIYPEEAQAKGLEILRVIEENAVDIIKLTPSHLALVRDFNLTAARVRKLIVGGEDFKSELAQAITDRYDGAIEIYNEYGPTETVVGCMIHRFDPTFDTGASVSIGKPADNVQIYILDDRGRPVPGGVIGEIVIAGDGVGRGYLNRPSLTSESFVPNPFGEGRMYRTGDRGRWTRSGTMDFLGRMDHQVKIGGARIELGEVEAALLAHKDLVECIVEVRYPQEETEGEPVIEHCVKCGLPSTAPSTTFDADRVCNWCAAFDRYRDQADAYFGSMDDLKGIFAERLASRNGESDSYDALLLLSGGKDSSYALYQLVEMGLKVLVFSLDNGYISDEAKANIQRVVDDLGLELVWGRTPAMNAIFVDSLNRFSNVCNGCFKTIYTLSMQLARERGIRYIVTGLTRGQIFETRLEEQFRNQIFDTQQIDQTILEARKAYHGMYDAVAEHLDVDIFKDDSIFNEIEFIDFYRYSDVELDEMLAFLAERAPWIRPSDTGRSTNCLINEAGIYIHTKERGFHNYAFPYSWDVRLGHKTRQAVMDELDDDIDVERVQEMLREIGYDPKVRETHRGQAQLAAYYVAKHPIPIADLKRFAAQQLPDYMVPAQYVPLEAMPLTPNGKVDRASLPAPGGARPDFETQYEAPRNTVEARLTDFWSSILKIQHIGIHDNFFDLGGTSLPAIQFINRIQREYQIEFPIQTFFEAPTISRSAEKVEALILKQIEGMSDDEVELWLSKMA